MGSRIQKIATIIFALAFVAILAVMNSNILNLGNNANKKLTSTISMTDNYDIDNYVNAELKGDQVVNAIKSGKNISTSSKLVFKVVTKQGSTVDYGYVNLNTTSNQSYFKTYTVTDATANDYINPNGDFRSTVTTNSNGVATVITFTQQ